MLDNQDKKFEISKAQPANIKPQDTIDLLELFYVLKKKILLILMAALIGGCVAGVYTQFFMTPVYSSMSSILVLSKETTLTSLADLQLGASLTSDFCWSVLAVLGEWYQNWPGRVMTARL